MNFEWSKILSQEEELKKEFTISKQFRQIVLITIVIGSITVCFFSLYAGILIFILGLVYWLYLTKSKHYGLTSRRIVLVDSFIGSSIVSIDYNQITDIEIEQSFVDQLGGWGTLVINTAGTHVPEIRLTFINAVQEVKTTIDQIRDQK